MRQIAAVFLASFAILAWGAGAPGIATSYVDPVAHIVAQDEAVYGSSSLGIAAHGGWLTPKFLGRCALYKPPLLYWLSAVAVKLIGPGALALRLPSIVAGAATAAVVFAGLVEVVPLASALTGALLLLSSHLFFVLSRIGLTDALLVFEVTLALYALARDRRLEAMRSRWIFGAATGAAIMTKAAAGLLPVLILVLAGVGLTRFVQVCAIAAAVAAPWHLWQLYQHPRWFWAEYFLSEHVVEGLSSPQQTTQESQIGFYAKRIAALDPVLAAAAVAGLIRVRSRVTIAWIGVVLASVLGWQYRNAAYLAPMYPALAIAAGAAIPKKYGRAALAVAAAIFFAKVSLSDLPFQAETVNPARAALDEYAKRNRGNDLILVEPNDEFYSADLGLAHVRYVWITEITKRTQAPLDFEYLGITVSAADYSRLDELRPVFARRLHEWNLDSTEPLATAILARNREEVGRLIESHPHTDFYVPREMRSSVHDVWATGGNERVFLLSREVIERP